MARILLAWELGTGFGHVAPLRALAQALTQRGHECVFAVRELHTAEEFLQRGPWPVLQAPLRVSAIRAPLRVQVSYASLLHNTGFDDALNLAAMLRAWRDVMRISGCDLLVADHAPCAVVAAHTLGLPTLQLGSGFTLPPATQPFPAFRPHPRLSDAVLQHNEQAVLAVLHEACERLEVALPTTLQQIFAHTGRGLLTYAELDHYEVRSGERYLGLPDQAHGLSPPWPSGKGPRLFGYLRPSRHLQATLAALARLNARVLVRIGGTDASKLRSFESLGLRIVDQAIDLREAARDCDGFINYAAHGTTAEMLLAGKPGVLLPDILERELVAKRAKQLGAALVLPSSGEFNLSEALRQLLEDPALTKAAQGFAQRYASDDRTQIMSALADRALALLKAPPRAAPAGA